MQENMTTAEKEALETERFTLACDRIAQITDEKGCGIYQPYFDSASRWGSCFLLYMRNCAA